MPGNPLVRFDEGRVGRTARGRPLSYSTLLVLSAGIRAVDINVGRGSVFVVNRPGSGLGLWVLCGFIARRGAGRRTRNPRSNTTF